MSEYDFNSIRLTDKIAHGLNGQYNWARRKIWPWELKGYTALGWKKSAEPYWLKPVVVRRYDQDVH